METSDLHLPKGGKRIEHCLYIYNTSNSSHRYRERAREERDLLRTVRDNAFIQVFSIHCVICFGERQINLNIMDQKSDNSGNDSKLKPKSFRYVQSTLLLLLVITIAIYIITLIADIVSYHNQIGFLFLTLILDLLAITILSIGIRGVALEIFHFVAAFAIVAAIVTIGQATTFAFRSPLLTTFNFLLDIAITGLGFVFSWMLYQDLLSKGGATVIPNINICIVKKANLEDDKTNTDDKE